MKKILLTVLMAFIVMSCSDDDDATIPQCAKPKNVSTSSITFESANISWDAINGSASYKIEYGTSGFILGSGTSTTTTEDNITINGLAASTTYDVYVKSICSTSNTSTYASVLNFTTAAPLVNPQFLPNLSELNLFTGELNDLTPSPYTFIYELNTILFTDYAHKQRIIALPPGTTMDYVDNGFPDFPNNTVIAKTFYYENDERDESLGKTIIETRILIKVEGNWQLGNYKWNADQTEAILDDTSSNVLVEYIDSSGDTNNVDYVIPSAQQCFDCHNNSGTKTPIGPKLRTMNFNNQLQDFIADGHLGNITDPTSITTLPNWEDDSYTLEERARAYFDINCAHCHSDGGFCQFQSQLRLTYETPFADSYIFERKASIDNRMQTYNNTYSMPLIGTTMVHDEGYTLIRQYLNTL